MCLAASALVSKGARDGSERGYIASTRHVMSFSNSRYCGILREARHKWDSLPSGVLVSLVYMSQYDNSSTRHDRTVRETKNLRMRVGSLLEKPSANQRMPRQHDILIGWDYSPHCIVHAGKSTVWDQIRLRVAILCPFLQKGTRLWKHNSRLPPIRN